MEENAVSMLPASAPRPHAVRLRFDMKEVRAQLAESVSELTPETFGSAPVPGMRSPRELLQEIGTMEVMCRSLITGGDIPDWQETSQRLDADTPDALLANLNQVRADTLKYLDTVTEAGIENPVSLAEDWRQWFDNAVAIEPEELLRWVYRNEYYHLGQLYVYSQFHAAQK